MPHDHDTIVAPATAPGGALCVIRMSGGEAIALCDHLFRGRNSLAEAEGYTLHYGAIYDGERVIDEVLVSLFRAPRSYTGEDLIEISCHGSRYVVSEILRLLCREGARMASPGEFTTRAYLNGKMDLSQAEAVADLIASSSRAAHALATHQMRGGYSSHLEELRERLLHLTALLELELDFSEEEVEFASRHELRTTMEQILAQIQHLSGSFALGNAIKQGVAVALVGAPNVGKSTLLNCLLGEERALVSEIAGTTRDVIEEATNIDGVLFRFVDTAGIRATDDRLEQMGIERTLQRIEQAQLIVHLIDGSQLDGAALPSLDYTLRPDQHLLQVVNKCDLMTADAPLSEGVIALSAKEGRGIDSLRKALREVVDTHSIDQGEDVVSSSRHAEALHAAEEALRSALAGLNNDLPTDLLSEEIRQVITHLGSITGRGLITPDEVLYTIFGKFCIGK